MMFPPIIFETPHHFIVDFASSCDSPNFFKHVLTSLCTEPSDLSISNIIKIIINNNNNNNNNNNTNNNNDFF